MIPLPQTALALTPPDRRPIHEWAAQHVELPPIMTIRGRFNIDISRHFYGPLSALDDEYIRDVAVSAPVRSGKSLIADLFVAHRIANDPGPTLWNFQKDESAAEYAETRVWPLLEKCAPAWKKIEGLERFKKRTCEIIFPDMYLILQGPALSNLQGKPCRYLINDETWLYPPGRLAEAKARVGDYLRMGISKVLDLCQGGEPDSESDLTWIRSTRHEWRIVCESCGHRMFPRWSGLRADGTKWGMRWDEHRHANGDWQVNHVLPTIRYECEQCAHPHLDTRRTKTEWNRTGDYLQTNHDSRESRRGYHWTAIIDYPWAELVEEFLHASNARRRGVMLPMIQFFQKRMGEFMGEARLLEQSDALPTASYDVRSDWPEESARFFTVDRQAEDVYWGTVRAWSKTGESRRLWFGRMMGAAEIEARRLEYKVAAQRTFVDSGHEAKGDFGVYSACAKYGWIATKGSGQRSFTNQRRIKGKPVLVQCAYKDPQPVSPGQGSRRQCWLIVYSADEMKDRVSNLIKLGRWKEPATAENPELEDEYRTQMAAEFKKPKKDKFTGRWVMVWVCPSGNNHAYDCSGLQCLGATICEILPDYDPNAQHHAS